MNFENSLIEFVRINPLIYDKNHHEFKNQPKKDEIWRKISTALGVPEARARLRWKSLRNNFRVSNEKMKKDPNTKISWKFYNSLKFLINYTQQYSKTHIKCQADGVEHIYYSRSRSENLLEDTSTTTNSNQDHHHHHHLHDESYVENINLIDDDDDDEPEIIEVKSNIEKCEAYYETENVITTNSTTNDEYYNTNYNNNITTNECSTVNIVDSITQKNCLKLTTTAPTSSTSSLSSSTVQLPQPTTTTTPTIAAITSSREDEISLFLRLIGSKLIEANLSRDKFDDIQEQILSTVNSKLREFRHDSM